MIVPSTLTSRDTNGLTRDSYSPPLSVFMLVSDLPPVGVASAVRLLATGLPRDRFRVSIGILGNTPGPMVDELIASGLFVHSLPIRGIFDWSGNRRLRQLLKQESPAIVHVWGRAAAQNASMFVPRPRDPGHSPRLVVSGVGEQMGGLAGWFLGWRIRRADRVVVANRSEGERVQQAGVASERLTLIGPAVQQSSSPSALEKLFSKLGIPDDSQLLVAGGRSERGIGPKDAIVAFDMLRYETPNLHMLVFGTDSESRSLNDFGRALAFDDYRIHITDRLVDRAAAIQHAEAVFVTRTHGGAEEALEAMAAGKPVVGWRTPELIDVVEDGVTGFLAPLGDRATLAARMRKLLDEPELARRLGEAGRSRALERFSVERMIEQHARLYAELGR